MLTFCNTFYSTRFNYFFTGITMPPNEYILTAEDRRKSDDHSIRIALLEQSMESIKLQLQGINANMSKLVWLVFTALIVAVLKMVITSP